MGYHAGRGRLARPYAAETPVGAELRGAATDSRMREQLDEDDWSS